jgi:hypothetical protein
MAKRNDPTTKSKLRLQKETLRKLVGIETAELTPVAGGNCWPSGGQSWTGARNTSRC